MIRVGIIGGAGYTAGELLRLLLWHPEVELTFVQSNSQAGLPITSVHKDLIGETSQVFVKEAHTDIDVLFLCAGHGRSRTFLQEFAAPKGVKIIDLSSDFRLKNQAEGFLYGLPELNRKSISTGDKIANPGCFATAIQLALLPLAQGGLLGQEEVHIHAITGSTGAGQQPTPNTHFSRRNNNVSVYKAFTHQHLAEIYQSINQLQPDSKSKVNFVPVRGNFTRGIFASLYLNCPLSQEEAEALFTDFFEPHPFVHVVKESPDLKQVVNTNRCLLHLQKHEGKLHIISIIDNLLKGASGQAVQNMNLMFGLPETSGLRLKAGAF